MQIYFRVWGFIIANTCCITTIKRSEKQSLEIGKVGAKWKFFLDLIYQDKSQRFEENKLYSIYGSTNELLSSNYSKVCERINNHNIYTILSLEFFISYVMLVPVGKLIFL